jgi:RNA polymerase sigma factor (sigma-70 family)
MNETTTQVCTSCQEEKEISEFHRRRNKHQTICKECRNASARSDYQVRGKARLPHVPTQINIANFPAMQERIVTLEPRIRSLASRFAHDKLEANDIYSEMIEAILTKCQPEDSDGFLMKRANWTGQAFLAKNLSYNEYVGDLDVDEDALTAGGFKVVNTRTVEDAILERETFKAFQAIIKSLPVENQKVIGYLSVGMNQRQIAEKLEVSEQSVSERMKKIREQIAARMTGDMGLSFAQ